jgi:hypothetical protein
LEPHRRKRGELIDLPSAVIAAGINAGLTPIERCIALLAAVRDGRLVARPSFFQLQQVRKARAAGVPMHLITHEDVIILAKGLKSANSTELKDSHPEPECPPRPLSHLDTVVRRRPRGRAS